MVAEKRNKETMTTIQIITLCLFILLPILSAQMDTVKDKASSSVFYAKLAKWMYEKKVFKTLYDAERWFNIYGDSWRLKYINGNKEDGLIKWNWLGIKFDKPIGLTDAWHHIKGWFLIVLFNLIAINLPAIFIHIHWFFNYCIWITILSLSWWQLFEKTYNKK